MIKKLMTVACTLLIVGGSLPTTAVFAETTTEPLSAEEATMPTLTDEPTVARQSLLTDAATETTTSSETTPAATTDSTSTKEQPKKETTSESTQAKDAEKTATSESKTDEEVASTDEVAPQDLPDDTKLTEGVPGEGAYMIDRNFSSKLRGLNTAGISNSPWKGYGKAAGELTVGDLKDLGTVNISTSGLTDLTGIEYATNLTYLDCQNNSLTSLDLTANTLLFTLYCQNNQIKDISIYDNGRNVQEIDCGSNQIVDFTKIDQAATIRANQQIITMSLDDVQVDARNNRKIIDLIKINRADLTGVSFSSGSISNKGGTLTGSVIDFTAISKQALSEGTITYHSSGSQNNTDGKFSAEYCKIQFEPYNPKVLTEGNLTTGGDYDIDETLSYQLRTGGMSRWDGANKGANTLTVDDMETLDRITIGYLNLQSLKGLEFAANLRELTAGSNEFSDFEPIKKLQSLEYVDLSHNHIRDITGLTSKKLDTFRVDAQLIEVPIASLSFNEAGNRATYDELRTTNKKGLSAITYDVESPPTLKTNGDQIILEQVGRQTLRNKEIDFRYDSNDLTEAPETSFSGVIRFVSNSDKYLTEGKPGDGQDSYDIDADLAELLKTESSATNLGESFSGLGNTVLTDVDMEAIGYINLTNHSLTSVKGVHYAKNATSINFSHNQLTSLDDFKERSFSSLRSLTVENNKITDISGLPNDSVSLAAENQSIEVPYPEFSVQPGNYYLGTIITLGLRDGLTTTSRTFAANFNNQDGEVGDIRCSPYSSTGDIMMSANIKPKLEKSTVNFIWSYPNSNLPRRFTGTIAFTESLQETKLVEGKPGQAESYDIDADFAKILRTDPEATVSLDPVTWSGLNKEEGQLTMTDMEKLYEIKVDGKGLESVKGVNFARNLHTFSGSNNRLTHLDDFKENFTLIELTVENNQITDITGTSNERIELAASNQQIRLPYPDFTKKGDKYTASIITLKLPTDSEEWAGGITKTFEAVFNDQDNESSPVTCLANMETGEITMECNKKPRLGKSTVDFNWDYESVYIGSKSRFFTGSITFEEGTLTEGTPGQDEPYDIDAKFAKVLRENADATNLGTGWSGFGKKAGELTKTDMEALDYAIYVDENELTSVKGLNFAKNLKRFNGDGNKLTNLDDFKENESLDTISVLRNQITDITGLPFETGRLTAEGQEINIDYPTFKKNDETGKYEATIDILKLPDPQTDPGVFRYLTIEPDPGTSGLSATTNESNQIILSCPTQPIFDMEGISFYWENSSISQKSRQFGGFITFSDRPLIEGNPGQAEQYDIDAKFAKVLRENANATNLGADWSGYGKEADQLTVTDMEALRTINVNSQSLTSIKGVNFATNVIELQCATNQISSMDLDSNVNLQRLSCFANQLTSLKLDNNTELRELRAYGNLTNLRGTLDLSNNLKLTHVGCNGNTLTSLILPVTDTLVTLNCNNNRLTGLDISKNANLRQLNVHNNSSLGSLILNSNQELTSLSCYNTNLTELDVSANTKLTSIDCSQNQISDISSFSGLSQLATLNLSSNRVSDITSLNGLSALNTIDASNQSLTTPVPTVNSGEATVNVLNTTSGSTLSLAHNQSNGITPRPYYDTDGGNLAKIRNTKRKYLRGKAFDFSYSNIQEGASSGVSKTFSGTITFEEGTLIEGSPNAQNPGLEDYDIDATLAQLIRRNSTNTTTISGNTWSGLNKEKDQLTVAMMEELSVINVGRSSQVTANTLVSLKGIDYATNLTKLNANYHKITEVDLSDNLKLTELEIYQNQLSSIDITNNTQLTLFNVQNNVIETIDFSGNALLEETNISNNQITELNLDQLTNLKNFRANTNKLTSIDASNNVNLEVFEIFSNEVRDISSLNGLNNLKNVNFRDNKITDITCLLGKRRLTNIDGRAQRLTVSVPSVINGVATIDLLKTTSGSTLTTSANSNNPIDPTPSYSAEGNLVKLGNTRRSYLSGKAFDFSFANLQEGASSNAKSFSGTVTFDNASDSNQTLAADKTKAEVGETVGFTWNVYSINDTDMQNVQTKLTLPDELSLDINSIRVNDQSGSEADINGTKDHGTLNKNGNLKITFNATVLDAEVLKWLTTTGTVSWSDSANSESRFNNVVTAKVQVKDDQQDYQPSDELLAITSVPTDFNFGYRTASNESITHHLRASDYRSNTKVPQNGFYVRVQNNRQTNSGWSLTAALSSFENQNGGMPIIPGASLKFENMTAENVLNPDTEDESINNPPLDPPKTVASSATLASRGDAQKLISAEANQAAGTWQLQIPFSGVSLELPAQAGYQGEVYQAKVTWSLNSTP